MAAAKTSTQKVEEAVAQMGLTKSRVVTCAEIREIRRNRKVPTPRVRSLLRDMGFDLAEPRLASGAAGNTPAPVPRPKGRTRKPSTVPVESLVAAEKLDTVQEIQRCLLLIPEGEVAYERDLIRDVGVSPQRFREAARDPKFEDFKARFRPHGTGGTQIIWGPKKTIAALRDKDGVS